MKTYVRLVFLLLVLFIGGVNVHAAEEVAKPLILVGSDGNIPQQMEGFNLSGYSDSGAKSWDIKGDKANIKGNQVEVTNVNANNYDNEDTNLKAKKGNIDKSTGDVHLQEDVVITTENGAQMKTDTLDWNRTANVVKTADVVTLEDETMKIKGQGMEAHPALKTAKLESAVTADIQAESKDAKKDNRIQITSDGPMEIDQAKQTAVFHDNVVAVESGSDRGLKSDRMEVLFDPKTKKIKEIYCTGHVEVRQGNNVTYSDSLVYKADEQRMVLTGKPKLILDTGDKTMADTLKF
ncbi:MAG: LPS export ABC transporter periplasmic protein LptC [Candidatus Omnitrophica bacterium]|nr:LPS export ABC transporter periplasmic protein LptC [Candidatus Omnitrophota bacterium]